MNAIKNFLCLIVSVIVFTLSTYFTISILLKHEETVICPDIRGQDILDAKRFLESQGFALNIVRYERRNDVPYNHITVQKPEANMPMRKGRIINVLVSEGPELVRIPSLIGLDFEDAGKILETHDIDIEKTIYIPHINPGKVIAQIPRGTEEVAEGQKVTLFVGSKQNKYYLMPDVRGIDIHELTEELDSKNIKYKTSSTRWDYPTSTRAVNTSVVPKTVFSSDDEITINVTTGG